MLYISTYLELKEQGGQSLIRMYNIITATYLGFTISYHEVFNIVPQNIGHAEAMGSS